MTNYKEKNKVINEIISLIRENKPTDIANTEYTSNAKAFIPSLKKNTPKFCDTIILWSMEENNISEIRNICKEYFGISCKVSLITASKLTDNDIAPKGTDYFSIKLSLSKVKLEKVISSLQYIISSNIILHDIDITQDIPYITHREEVKKYILKKGIEQKLIVDDLSKVGRNCISFYNKDPSDKESLLRIKVYNKFVQILESCDVRTTLGSRIHNLFVDPSRSMKNIFELTKYTGLTRIEIKFYRSSIYDVNYYVNRFNYIKDKYLQGCKFYKVSFENQ